jgi:hypothetical protein
MRRRVGTVKRHLKLHSHDRSLTRATDIGTASLPAEGPRAGAGLDCLLDEICLCIFLPSGEVDGG